MRTRRPGITLVEVLVAIFIMGIGMLAILVLFPLGALNMARALKDDRCGTVAANADALAAAFNLRADPLVLNWFQTSQTGFSIPDPNGPSNPVFIDPYYAISGYSTVGSSNGITSNIARISPYFAQSTQNADIWFTFLDDLYFDTNGLPTNFTAGPVLQRQGYYTYTYMLRRMESQLPNSVQLWVIVYSGRSTQVPIPEPAFSASGSLYSTSVTLTWGAGIPAPDLRRGSWLLDNTYTPPNTVPLNLHGGYVNGKFYKVMEAINLGGNTMALEVYPPIQDANVSQMVVLTNAVEVFDRGTGR